MKKENQEYLLTEKPGTLMRRYALPCILSLLVAFFGVYYKLQNFLFMPLNDLGQAVIPIAGYNYGAGRPDRVRKAGRLVCLSACAIALAGTAVFHLFGSALLGLFSAGEAMLWASRPLRSSP